MDYATVADMVARFGEREMIQLTDADNLAAVQPERIALKLADAQALADASLGRVFALPLRGCAKPTTVPGAAPDYVPPPQLTRIVCDVARYYLYHDLAPEHEVYLRFKGAERELQAIAEGKSVLACPWGGTPGAAAAASSVSGEVLYSFSPRAMTDDVLGGFR